MVIPAVSGDEGDGYRCYANEDIGADATELIRTILFRDHPGRQSLIAKADVEAVCVLLATILADVLNDIAIAQGARDIQERPLAVTNLLTGRMGMIRRGDEIW